MRTAARRCPACGGSRDIVVEASQPLSEVYRIPARVQNPLMCCSQLLQPDIPIPHLVILGAFELKTSDPSASSYIVPGDASVAGLS